MLNKKAYTVLKFIAQIALPGVGALYFGLAQIWHLPKAEEIVGTVTVIDTFLGLMLGLSTNQYNKSWDRYDGVIEVTDGLDRMKYLLNLNGVPDEVLLNKDEVLFKVQKTEDPPGRHKRP